MKSCLIYQQYGLGDILWAMQIVDHYISQGYTVYYPVGDIFYNEVSTYIKKEGLEWKRESEDFPLKFLYGTTQKMELGEDVYLPVAFAQHIVPAPLMPAKLFLTGTPIKNWWGSLNIERNLEREQKLIDTYNLTGDYIIVNKAFGTNPVDIEVNIESNFPIHVMSFERDRQNGFNIFDWISALQNAKEIHTVHTSLCYIIDKYCFDNEIHMYERKLPGQSRSFHSEAVLVFRNPGWIYED